MQRTLGIACDVSSFAQETQRLIRSQFASLVPNMDDANLTQMNLGLSHSLSRYKIKFSPDKVDTMIVQAVALLDDLDKEVRKKAKRQESLWCLTRVCGTRTRCSSTLTPCARASGTVGTFRSWRRFSTTTRRTAVWSKVRAIAADWKPQSQLLIRVCVFAVS